MTTLLEIRDLVFEYPGFRALHCVSGTIETGTITALVGPNGAGKTTLLRCVAALDAPFSGAVLLDGADVHRDPRESHRRMGYLSDFFGLYDELTVRQCLTYRARIQGIERVAEDEAIAWAADAVSLGDRMGQKAGELSRGLRQRLAIAQSILHRPKLLLLDEPASGLDPEARHELAGLMTALRDLGMTIVVSSHILAELEDYSTHMMIIDNGAIVDHAAIDGAAAEAARMQVRVLNGTADLEAFLSGRVESLTVEETGARFVLQGGPEAQQTLLGDLVKAGIPVLSFGPEQISLQDTYIERVRGGRDR